jgi:hypothetical protein
MASTTPNAKKNRRLRKRARQINRFGLRKGLPTEQVTIVLNLGLWQRWQEMERRLGVEQGALVQPALEEYMADRGIDWVMELSYPDRGIHE